MTTPKKHDDDKEALKDKPKSGPHTPAAHAHATPKKAGTEHTVTITPGAFSPSSLSISSGDSVRWKNNTGDFNGVVTDPPTTADPATPMPPSGEAVTVFDKPGSYSFNTESHPEIKGTVSVS